MGRIALTDFFPFYFDNTRHNFLLIIGVSGFVVAFMWLFQPFQPVGVHHSFVQALIFGMTCFAVLFTNLLLLPRLFPSVFEPTNWIFKKYLLFNVWQVLSVGLAFTVVNIFICQEPYSLWAVLVKTQWEVVLVAIFPLFFITFLIRNQILADNLANALRANTQLKALHEQTQQKVETFLILTTDTSETLSLLPKQFVYAEAQDNYTEVFYTENHQLRKKLLRITLKKLTEQLPQKEFLRCHRSYLVNLHHVGTVNGNASGFRLNIPIAEREIPVARSKGLEMGQLISDFRNLKSEIY